MGNNVDFSLIGLFIKITTSRGVASLQLPAIYLQLPVLLIGQIETLIWRISYSAFEFSLLYIFPSPFFFLLHDFRPTLTCDLEVLFRLIHSRFYWQQEVLIASSLSVMTAAQFWRERGGMEWLQWAVVGVVACRVVACKVVLAQGVGSGGVGGGSRW